MHAASFVGTIDNIDARIHLPRELRSCDPTEAARIHANAVETMNALLDLAEQFGLGMPLPTLDRRPVEAIDAAVADILNVLLDTEEVSDEQLDRVVSADRAYRVREQIVVPLRHRGPAAANWYVLLWWLHDRLTELSDACAVTRARVRTFEYEHLIEAFRAIEDMLTTFRRVVGSIVAEKTWIDPPEELLNDAARDLHRTATELVQQLEDTS